MTAAEILKKYPDLANKLQWNSADLGHFMRCKLVNGYYNRNKRVSMIEEASLLRVVGFINAGMEERKATMKASSIEY